MAQPPALLQEIEEGLDPVEEPQLPPPQLETAAEQAASALIQFQSGLPLVQHLAQPAQTQEAYDPGILPPLLQSP